MTMVNCAVCSSRGVGCEEELDSVYDCVSLHSKRAAKDSQGNGIYDDLIIRPEFVAASNNHNPGFLGKEEMYPPVALVDPWMSFRQPPLATRIRPPSSSSSCCVMLIGVVGVALGVAGAIAYAILQVPALRRSLYVYPDDVLSDETRGNGTSSDETLSGNETSSFDETTVVAFRGVYSAGEVVYGYELAGVLVGTFLGILANALLVYGTSVRASPFLLPYLAFQVFFIALLLLALLLVLVLASPAALKAFALIPLAVAALETYLWVRVYKHYKHLRRDSLMATPLISHYASAARLDQQPWAGGCYGQYGCPGCHGCLADHAFPARLQQQAESSEGTYRSFSDF